MDIGGVEVERIEMHMVIVDNHDGTITIDANGGIGPDEFTQTLVMPLDVAAGLAALAAQAPAGLRDAGEELMQQIVEVPDFPDQATR